MELARGQLGERGWPTLGKSAEELEDLGGRSGTPARKRRSYGAMSLARVTGSLGELRRVEGLFHCQRWRKPAQSPKKRLPA